MSGTRGDLAGHDLRRAWVVLGVVGLASLQTAMALSIIFVVYPDLEASFPDESAATLSWVVNAFTIVGASTLVLGSAISERWGRKRSLMTGTFGFAAASAVAAVAPSVPLIVAARVVQALSASLSLPSGATLVLRAFPQERRATAIGTWSAIGAVAAALGPSMGGFLIDAGSWRWAFWFNVPLGAIAFVAEWLVLDESRSDEPGRLPDLGGSALVLGGVSALIYGLVQSDDWGWGDPRTIAAIAIGLALTAALLRRSTHHPRPVIRLDLFGHRSYLVGNISMTLYSISFFSFQFVSILFLTKVWGYSIRDAGLLGTPIFVFTGILSVVAGRWSDRSGHRRVLVPGALLWNVSIALLIIGLSGERSLGLWLAAASIGGVGSGLLWGALFGYIMRDLRDEQLSAGASVNQTTQRIGNAVGVAIAVTLIGSNIGLNDAGDVPLALWMVLLTGLATGGFAMAGSGGVRNAPAR
ncbi:MAG: MFS transporter [Acidimicrobiales bacterium]|nr:MFS transporter [Acidimicrobiales bacterium]